MDPVVLWTKCAHAGAHVRDLTMEGAFIVLACGFIGWMMHAWWVRSEKRASVERDD